MIRRILVVVVALITIMQPVSAQTRTNAGCAAVPAYAARLRRFQRRDFRAYNQWRGKELIDLTPEQLAAKARDYQRYAATMDRMLTAYQVPPVATEWHHEVARAFDNYGAYIVDSLHGDTAMASDDLSRRQMDINLEIIASRKAQSICGADWPFPTDTGYGAV